MNTMIVFHDINEYYSFMQPDLDLRLLRVFSTLAQTGSHARAAETLHVTPSAISHGMKRLESQLGCALFYKKGKSAHLTQEGRTFQGQVFRILESIDRAAESVSGSQSDSRGRLSVTFSDSIGHLILAPVLREFRECYPDISLSVQLGDSTVAIKSVEDGESDIALAISNGLPRSLKAHALFEDELVLVYSPQHPWADRKRLASADLAREHYLFYKRNTVTFRSTEEFFLKNGIRPRSQVEISSFEIMKQLARLALGIAIMPAWVASRELEEGSLLSRSIPRFAARRSWGAIYLAQRPLRPAELTFIGLCRMACDDHFSQRPGRARKT